MAFDFKLVKFTNYGDDFSKGNLYLNSLEYYRGVEKILNGHIEERNDAINDYIEGSVASVNVKDLHKFGIDFGEEIKKNLVGNVHLLSEELKYLKLLCLYAFCYDKENNRIFQPNEKLYTFGAREAVIITDTDEFVKRMHVALNKRDTNIISMKCGLVDYYDNDDKTKILGPFNKKADLVWQQEFRFIFQESSTNIDPTILCIGDISDIIVRITAKEFVEDIVSFYLNNKNIL